MSGILSVRDCNCGIMSRSGIIKSRGFLDQIMRNSPSDCSSFHSPHQRRKVPLSQELWSHLITSSFQDRAHTESSSPSPHWLIHRRGRKLGQRKVSVGFLLRRAERTSSLFSETVLVEGSSRSGAARVASSATKGKSCLGILQSRGEQGRDGEWGEGVPESNLA